MESDEVLGIVFAEAKHIAEIDGLYLSGSHGSGCADEFSDVDYVAVAKPENIQTVVERWEAVCRKHFNVVFLPQTGWRDRTGQCDHKFLVPY